MELNKNKKTSFDVSGGDDERPEKGGVEERPETGVVTVVDEGSDADMRSRSSHDSDSSRKGRLWKRKRRSDNDCASDESDCVSGKVHTARRGRGRPPTTGKYVGLAKAKAEYIKQCERELELEAESEAVEITRQVRATRSATSLGGACPAEGCSTLDLHRRAQECVEAIIKLTKGSKNLKGTFKKAYNETAEALSEVLGTLYTRTTTDEIRLLQEGNDRLQAENAQLRSEIAELRQGVADLRRDLCATPAPVPSCSRKEIDDDSFVSKIMDGVGKMLDARFRNLEASGRLLPEARVRAVEAPASQPTETSVTTLAPPANPAPRPAKAGQKKKKKKKKAGAATQVAAPNEPRPLPPAPAALTEGWNVVARKGRKAGPPKNQPQPQNKGEPAKKPKTPKLRLPRSAAVQLTLLPGSTRTYAEVLGAIKADGLIASMGVETRYRVSQTGARRLELPGTGNKEKAEELARRIKAVVGEDVAVTRPEKCADLRVAGLDDSVTPQELAGVIAKAGGCAEESIKVGEVRQNFAGIGTAWVRLPVEAAKKVVDGRRLLVGFVSASVTLLKTRPQQCYRCHEVGHVAAKCDKGVDRSGQCYRCGKEGHIRRQCTAEACCPICQAEKKAAGHSLVACPRNKAGRRKKAATKNKTRAPPANRAGEVTMDTQL
ncbi:uncharacterized protein LOC123670050 [Melitaea cinxia]|uniref:uncharacterized protein LOC123670050 n=1 Tax=Melitaea cinxia TaxID=113334 RepID=UPI001E27436B|nr:uncharacterized protein LOC123670050 [Melitaea cinxia]